MEEFGVGFPPRLWGIKRGETIYSINWVPLGGFVKLKGEGGEDTEDLDSFAHKKIWERSLIISAGVIMNILLAALLLGIGFIFGIPQAIDENLPSYAKVSDQKINIMEVIDGYPAKAAEIELGDVVSSIDGNEYKKITEMQNYLADKNGQPVIFKIQRGEEVMEKEIAPVILEEGYAGIGVGLVESGKISYPWHLAFWEGLKATIILLKAIILAFYELFKNLILGYGLTAELSGPVGIAVVTGKVARMGILHLLQFTAILSVNLAIINFLPFPALDGGRFLFLIIEKIRRKPVNQKIENFVHNTGFLLLMLLVIIVTYQDIVRFGGKFLEIWQKIIN